MLQLIKSYIREFYVTCVKVIVENGHTYRRMNYRMNRKEDGIKTEDVYSRSVVQNCTVEVGGRTAKLNERN